LNIAFISFIQTDLSEAVLDFVGAIIQSWFAHQRDALISIFNFVKTVE